MAGALVDLRINERDQFLLWLRNLPEKVAVVEKTSCQDLLQCPWCSWTVSCQDHMLFPQCLQRFGLGHSDCVGEP